jgi:hypothetical protein
LEPVAVVPVAALFYEPVHKLEGGRGVSERYEVGTTTGTRKMRAAWDVLMIPEKPDQTKVSTISTFEPNPSVFV